MKKLRFQQLCQDMKAKRDALKNPSQETIDMLVSNVINYFISNYIKEFMNRLWMFIKLYILIENISLYIFFYDLYKHS